MQYIQCFGFRRFILLIWISIKVTLIKTWSSNIKKTIFRKKGRLIFSGKTLWHCFGSNFVLLINLILISLELDLECFFRGRLSFPCKRLNNVFYPCSIYSVSDSEELKLHYFVDYLYFTNTGKKKRLLNPDSIKRSMEPDSFGIGSSKKIFMKKEILFVRHLTSITSNTTSDCFTWSVKVHNRFGSGSRILSEGSTQQGLK